MKNNELEDELIFYPSKLKNILLTITSIIFVLMGIIIIFEKNNYFLGLCCTLFFGLSAIFTIKELFLNKSYLKIKKEGFEYAVNGKLTFIRWHNIEEFKLYKLRMITMIGWIYTSESKKMDVLSKTSRVITKIDELLPDTYGLNPKELMSILVKYWTIHTKQ